MTGAGQAHDTPYLRACNGLLRGVLRWHDFDALWARLQDRNDGGYLYVVGEPPPTTPASHDLGPASAGPNDQPTAGDLCRIGADSRGESPCLTR
jgi:hypothetical protein